eukprot:TRINITY_DN32370_c0_g1_i1.p1 TRINITY_DN32370_c0_g1~~TRINITY_DN32370_c0_g1_i1.p1  ORF type:complete len:1041 (+),score=177.94 TRINITY_DN32370_c0_g1_i1:85-3207(+)
MALARSVAIRQKYEEAGDFSRKRALEEDGPATRVPKKLGKRAASAAGRQAVSSTLRVRESALFRPVRAIGVVTDSLPLALQKLGDATFCTASIGRGFQVFECDKLRLAYIGPRLNEKIRAHTTVGDTVITALKKDIVVWHKLTEIGRFCGHRGSATVLCPIGSGFLLSASSEEALVWQLSDVGLENPASASKEGQSGRSNCVLAPLGRLNLGQEFGSVTAVRHPPTYLHKVLIGGTSGSLELWNVRSRERIHAFRSHLAGASKNRKEGCGVTCIMEAPNALDMAAIGFADGRICVMNIREDRVLFEFQQAQGRVTCLAFRSGVGANEFAHLVSGAPTGDLVVWDLEKRRAHHVLEAAHRGPISSIHFMPDEPILITSGRDNAVRMWIFDTADGLPRYLKGRVGCPGPARRLSYYGSQDKELLVGGGFEGTGYLSKVSFIQDHQNNEFSQAALKKMTAAMRSGAHIGYKYHLPPVVDVAFCQVRHFDWPAVVTAHNGMEAAMVWSASHQALSTNVLRPPPEENGASPVSAVAISSCGNYCVLGLENGALHRFNLQSGLHRGAIPKLPDMAQEMSKVGEKAGRKKKAWGSKPDTPPRAHSGRVSGLSITVTGNIVSTASHPKDCCLKIWKLSSHEEVDTIPLGKGRPGSPSCLLMRSLGSLYAVSLDDGTLRIADLNGMSVVRSFACGVPATDLAFTSDGRWLAAALCDGGLRIFDLPAARCIDSFVFAQPALACCFSPSTAFLLTTHAKNNSIQVWANKFLFDPSLSAPLLRPEPTAPIHVDEPGGDKDENDDEDSDDEQAAGEAAAPEVSAVPLEPELLTLSDVPPQKVLATLHLDLVKERNKASEIVKPLPNAPFFLPTAHEGVTPRFAAPGGEEEGAAGDADASGDKSNARPSLLDEMLQEEQEKSRSGVSAGMPFQTFLRKGNFDKALEFLKSQTPSGVHLAIEELGPLAGGDEKELKAALEFFMYHMDKSHYADEIQVFLNLFLQAHGEEVVAAKELRSLCAELGRAQENMWNDLSTQCQKSRCFLGMLTQTQSQW